MKNYKVIFTSDTKGKNAETTFIVADCFKLVKEKGYRCLAFFSGDELKAMFTADKITAIFEI